MNTCLLNQLIAAYTFDGFSVLVAGLYPDISEDYYMEVKVIIDLTISNSGSVVPNEFLSIAQSMKELEGMIQEGQSPDSWEIAKTVLQCLITDPVEGSFSEAISMLANYLLELIQEKNHE